MQKAAEEATSDIFFLEFKQANTWSKSLLWYFIEGTHTKIGSKESLDDIFERNFER